MEKIKNKKESCEPETNHGNCVEPWATRRYTPMGHSDADKAQ